MDKDLHELCSIPIKMLLANTENKQFFTQKEFEDNYGVLMIIAANRSSIEKKLQDKAANTKG